MSMSLSLSLYIYIYTYDDARTEHLALKIQIKQQMKALAKTEHGK